MKRLVKIRNSLKEHIYYILAGNPNTPARVLKRLAKSPCLRVRIHVAENENTPESTIFELMQDVNMEVRLTAARNKQLDYCTISDAIENGDDSVRYMIAEDSTMPSAILFSLCFAENPYVQSRAEKTLKNKSRLESKV